MSAQSMAAKPQTDEGESKTHTPAPAGGVRYLMISLSNNTRTPTSLDVCGEILIFSLFVCVCVRVLVSSQSVQKKFYLNVRISNRPLPWVSTEYLNDLLTHETHTKSHRFVIQEFSLFSDVLFGDLC